MFLSDITLEYAFHIGSTRTFFKHRFVSQRCLRSTLRLSYNTFTQQGHSIIVMKYIFTSILQRREDKTPISKLSDCV